MASSSEAAESLSQELNTLTDLLGQVLQRLSVIESSLQGQNMAAPSKQIGDKRDAAIVLGCSIEQVRRIRVRSDAEWEKSKDYPWILGTHYFQNGTGQTCSYAYNLDLLADWRINRLNHPRHQKAVNVVRRLLAAEKKLNRRG